MEKSLNRAEQLWQAWEEKRLQPERSLSLIKTTKEEKEQFLAIN